MAATSKLVVAAGVGITGFLFVCYCIYFDRKRRSQPDFMEKLRKKRAAERRKREEAMKINFPYPPTMDSVNRFFVDNVSLSDELLSCGDIDGSAYYLAAALVGSGQTQECVEALRSTIPPELYNALLQKFPEMKLQFEMEIAKVKARYDRNRHTEHVLFDEAYD